MVQGIIGAFGVRVPVSYLMSLRSNATLFDIGLATPMSSILQLVLSVVYGVFEKEKNSLKYKDSH